jgi:hypothetical protein
VRTLVPAALAMVVLVAISACGSSAAKPVGFQSSSRRYSVEQVEAAFAKQGIRLHRVRVPEQKVLGGLYPNVSRAERRRLIGLARRQTRLLTRSLVVLRGFQPHQDVDVTVLSGPFPPADHVVSNGEAGHTALIHHGNLTGSFDTRDRRAVDSALAELH